MPSLCSWLFIIKPPSQASPPSPYLPDFLRTSALVEVPSREAYKSSKKQVSSPLLGQEAGQPEFN
jgi:hypothetical protein